MRGKIPWTLALLAVCVWILLSHSRLPGLLDDSDTRGILLGIRERNNPWSWFVGDWPLFNHFYRPISTLSFEIDWRVYGGWAQGYGLTNASLAVLSTLGCAWLAGEFFDDFRLGALTGCVFGLWTLNAMLWLDRAWIWGIALSGIVILRAVRRNDWRRFLVPAAVLVLGYELLLPVELLRMRMIEWLPGRTASTMTVFLLPALACWVRVAKLQTSAELQAKPHTQRWMLFGILLTVLAMLSYEQAVMIPLAAIPLTFARDTVAHPRIKRLGTLLGALVLPLILYAAARVAFIPPGTSRYQNQQFREGMGLWLPLGDYSLIPVRSWLQIQNTLGMGPEGLLVAGLWDELWKVLGLLLGVWALVAAHSWIMPLRIVLASFVLFLPMAFLHPFAHYHYAPMAIRAMLPVWLLAWAAKEFIRHRSPAPDAESPEVQPAYPTTSAS